MAAICQELFRDVESERVVVICDVESDFCENESECDILCRGINEWLR